MESLIAQFMERYLSRQEIIHRLPVTVSIKQFWPELEKERRSRAQELPLLDQDGNPFWFVLTGSIERQCNEIAALARRDIAFTGPEFDLLFEDAVVDEAVYSQHDRGRVHQSRTGPPTSSAKTNSRAISPSRWLENNYDALIYVLEHLDEEITEDTIIQIAKLVTQSAAEVQVSGYRGGAVCVTGREGVVYTPPGADAVPPMMRSLGGLYTKQRIAPIA